MPAQCKVSRFRILFHFFSGLQRRILSESYRKSVGWSVTSKLLSNSKEARLLQAIIDSFLSADRNFLFLLNFYIISRKCSAVTIGVQCTLFLRNDALTWKDRLHIRSGKKRLLLTKFLRVEQIILLTVIVCNSSKMSWSYFSLFVLKRCLVNGVSICLSVYETSTCVNCFIFYLFIHVFIFSFEILHFFYFTFSMFFFYCFPFSRSVRTSKECARVEKEPLCINRLLSRSNS